MTPRGAGGEGADGGPLALYVHWPFCLSKCPYCDFNSHVAGAIDHGRWRRALLRELEAMARRVPGRRLASVFFGGGTPSLMDPRTVEAVLGAARRLWPAGPDLETTLEANPTSVEAARLDGFRAAGIGRVSLGVQALDDAALRFLGRGHDAREAVAAVEAAHARFPRVSFDLIYARPGQGLAAWREELRRALALAGEHLSLYQLTIERGTPFLAAHRRGDFALPDDDAAGALYEETRAMLEESGRPAYEISNHAVPGAECRHNLAYWRTGDWIGVGPGAHGRFFENGARRATRTRRAPGAWLERVERDGHAIAEDTEVGAAEHLADMLTMGLRLAEGVPRARLAAAAGRPVEALFAAGALDPLLGEGYLALDGERLRATAAGRQRLDGVLRLLLGALRPPEGAVTTPLPRTAPAPGR